jgi:hypothetical protein
VTGHCNAGPDHIDRKLGPDGVPDVGDYGKPDRLCPAVHGSSTTYFKPKPVAEVLVCCRPKLSFGQLAVRLSIDVDVERGANANFPSEKSGRSFDDPPLIDEIEALEEAVVGDLPSQLL